MKAISLFAVAALAAGIGVANADEAMQLSAGQMDGITAGETTYPEPTINIYNKIKTDYFSKYASEKNLEGYDVKSAADLQLVVDNGKTITGATGTVDAKSNMYIEDKLAVVTGTAVASGAVQVAKVCIPYVGCL